MFSEYFKEELSIMPNYLKMKYLRSIKALIKEEKYQYSKNSIESMISKPTSIDDLLSYIADTYSELLTESYINIENNKSKKYSALFELFEDRKINELVDSISETDNFDNSLIKRNSSLKIDDIKAFKLNESTVKFTFLLDGVRIYSGTPIQCKTTYSVIAKFWLVENVDRKFVEISADNLATYFRYDQSDFFEDIINSISEFLEESLLSIEPIDLFETLENIKEKEKNGELNNLPKASAQKMLLSSGSQAVLDSNDAETIILPILGEIKKIIELELFSKSDETKAIKELLEEFVLNTELESEFPWITFTWDNKIKSKKIQVKFILSKVNPYTMMSYYEHSKGRGGMDDVVESLLREYCEIGNKTTEERSRGVNSTIS